MWAIAEAKATPTPFRSASSRKEGCQISPSGNRCTSTSIVVVAASEASTALVRISTACTSMTPSAANRSKPSPVTDSSVPQLGQGIFKFFKLVRGCSHTGQLPCTKLRFIQNCRAKNASTGAIKTNSIKTKIDLITPLRPMAPSNQTDPRMNIQQPSPGKRTCS